MSHSAENSVEESFSVSLFRVWKNSMHERICHEFLSKIFGSTILENFVVEPSCVSEIYWYRIIFFIRGGGLSRFSVRNFPRTVPKSFIAELFCAVFQKISGSDKVYG